MECPPAAPPALPPPAPAPPRRCLSIQSHVVHGYVGNKSATFPLQLLGFDVDAVNSVQLSTHTGYPSFAGQKLGGEDLQALVGGLAASGLLGAYTHVLTGYVGAETFLRAIVSAVRDVRAANPRAVYVCDPVLGDNGRLYVPPALVPLYREEVLPLASVLTPNQFEAEALSGVRITDVPSALAAIDALHARGPPTVVMTSSSLPPGQGDSMLLIASCPWEDVADEWSGLFAGVDRSAAPRAVFGVDIPRLDADFTGTGDLTAALLLAHAAGRPRSLVAAVEAALASVAAVCARTLAARDAAAAAAAAQLAGSAPRTWLADAYEATLAGRAAKAAAGGAGGEPAKVVAPTEIPAFAELALVASAGDLVAPPLAPGRLRARLLT